MELKFTYLCIIVAKKAGFDKRVPLTIHNKCALYHETSILVDAKLIYEICYLFLISL